MELMNLLSFLKQALQVPFRNFFLVYARNIVEYACYKAGKVSVNMRKVRPPYSSEIPKWHSDEEIKHLHIEYDEPDFKERKGREQNMIWDINENKSRFSQSR